MHRNFLRRSSFLLLSLLVLFCVGLAQAQTGTTSLRGTVSDKSGGAIVGAKVMLRNTGLGLERTATTGETGQYEFLGLQPGTYELVVEMPNFQRYVQSNLQLLVNSPATQDLQLQVGSTTETVEVSTQTETLNTTDASLGNAFGENQIKQLPLEGRNIPDLLTLQSGVVYTGNRADINKDTDTRSGAVNGARSDQSNVTLDGVDVNDQVNGYAFTSVLPVTADSVQEFRVTTTSYNADEGRSSGAQVSLVTKSGTNQFHGSAYEYHRNTLTSANDYLVKLNELQNGESNTPPKLIRNIFGGSVGGPIWKDRLFFFANYEGSRQAEETAETRIVPSDTLRAGIILYKCADPTACPGGQLPGTNFMIPSGVQAVSPSDLAAWDPLKIGPSPVILNYLQSFPEPTDLSLGDGLNYVGYRFRGPVPTTDNWYIARLDYKLTSSGNHNLFWRGAMRNDSHSTAPYFLGDTPLHSNVDYSKGFTIGYTATLRQNLINNFRYGYTRQSIGILGNNDTQTFIYFRGLNDNSSPNNSSLAVTRSQNYQTPVHNFVDDLSWIKGRHTFQFGTNVRLIRNPRESSITSFSDGVTNASGLDTAGLANKPGSPLNPSNHAFPDVLKSFDNSYDYPLMTLMGIVSEVDATYNFDKNGNALPLNSPVKRRWGADEYEFYFQDVYKVKSNFTFTYGLRYSLFSPPWETNGTQVSPTISLGQWFQTRGQDMLAGIPSNEDPEITFNLAGPANGKKGYYNWDYKDFGPRIAFAYSPNFSSGLLHDLFGSGGKTSIRGGFGIVYDRVGAGLLTTFDQYGSFGLSTQLSNSNIPSVASAPRVTDLNTLPTVDQNNQPFFPPTPSGGFPYTPPDQSQGLAINWGLDDTIKTPYSYTVDFSIGREFGKGFALEVSYVGRYSHRLLVQEDLAMPLNFKDTKSGITYFQAAHRFSELGAAGVGTADINPQTVGPTAAYWQDIIQPLATGDQYSLACSGGSTASALQAAYDLFNCNLFNETTSLWQLDQAGSDFAGTAGIAGSQTDAKGNPLHYYAPVTGASTFFNRQFKSLYAWRSSGNANYHALQVNLHKRLNTGLQFDFNYTFSKSIDIMSDAERVTEWGGLGGQVINSWDPNARRAVSDYDLTHQINGNWIYELPFGRNRHFGHDVNKGVDAIIGGWQLSGLARWTTGFPASVANGATWPTNWQLGGGAVQVGAIATGTTVDPPNTNPGAVSLFKDPQGILSSGAFRNGMPGESGGRNQVRGQGFAGLDMGLSKRWIMPWKESHSLQFRWEVFNVPNLHRFDVQSVNLNLDSGGAFGLYTGLLTNPRVMQFALRYEF
jgi:hypothetical protein